MAKALRRTFRGLKRQLIRKLQHSLLSIQKMDLRELLLSGSRGVPGDFFVLESDSDLQSAFQLISDRIDTTLSAKS